MSDPFDLTRDVALRTPGRRRNNWQATTAPGVGDDEAGGYGPGSRWINPTLGEVWTCLSAAAGAAVWKRGTGQQHDELGGLGDDDHLLYGIVYNDPNDPGTPPRNEAIWIDEDADGGSSGAPAVHPHDADEVWYDNAGGLYALTPSVTTMRPNDDGASAGTVTWTNSGTQEMYQQVDEPVNNRGDYVFLGSTGAWFIVYFGVWAGAATDAIVRVRAHMDQYNPAPTSGSNLYLRRRVENDESASILYVNQGGNGVSSSAWMTVNPFTGLPWTVADLGNLGLRYGYGNLNDAWVYQMWLEVEYTTGVTVQQALTTTQTEVNAAEAALVTHAAGPHGGGSGGTATATVGAMLRSTATQALSAGASTSLTFNSVDRDTDGFWSAGNPSRATVPAGLGGWYLVTGYMRPNVASGLLLLFLRINGDDNNIVDVFDQTAVNEGRYKNVWLVYLNPGDYVELRGYIVGGGTTGHATSVHLQNQMRLVKVGGGVVAGLDTRRYTNSAAGSILLNSATWANWDTATDLVIPAQAGDVLDITLNCLHGPEGITAYNDVATIVGGSPVNYVSGLTGAASDQGVLGWRMEASISSPVAGSIRYLVQAGDISGGTVTLRLRYRTSSASNKTVYRAANLSFHWSVVNLKGGAGPAFGAELAAGQRTTDVSCAGSEGSPTNVVSATSFVADGSTKVCVELYSASIYTISGSALFMALWEGTTNIQRVGTHFGQDSDERVPFYARIYLTPAAGTRTYHWKGFRSGGGDVGVQAGAGGSGVWPPAYIRVTRA